MRYLFISICALALTACGGGHGHHGHHGHPGPAHAGGQPEGAPSQAHGHHAPHHNHRFDNPEKWAQRWDSAERDAWQKPDEVLRLMALAPAQTIADIGAGTGYFAMRFARAVPQGKVYAVDLEQSMVDYLGERAEKEGLNNVEPVLATVDDPKLPAKVDVVFLSNTYHHIGDRSAYFARVRDMLQPGGKVVIVDYKVEFDGPGPPKPMRLAPAAVDAEMKAAGYTLESRDDSLPRQYVLIFTPGGS